MTPNFGEEISIRLITNVAEMREVEKLQKEVWGIPDIEVVPISQLAAAIAAGGCLLGAFDTEKLIGFALVSFIAISCVFAGAFKIKISWLLNYRNYLMLMTL